MLRAWAALGQLCLLQVGPRRCLRRLRVAPFWFFQLPNLCRRHRHCRRPRRPLFTLSQLQVCGLSWCELVDSRSALAVR